ncbi:MAG TPA: hypothetical protein VHQ65_15755 [Thermoanaerobaculia bacterium]|nr:hypothetical protein [Thermoanaerobaculia bacterium]
MTPASPAVDAVALDAALIQRVTLPERHPLRRGALLAAAVGALAVLALAVLGEPRRMLAAYLTAYVYWLTIALGGLFFVLVMFATRAGWSVTVRRLAEHVAGTLVLFAALFLPLALGADTLFGWWHGADAAADPVLHGKAGYLDPEFFFLRATAYLLAWSLLAFWFRSRSLAQDSSGDPATTRRLQALSAPALIVFGISLTFASFDWIMSLDPHWYSTIFGVYVFSGAVVAILAVLTLGCIALGAGRDPRGERPGPLAGVVTTEHLHDVAKLLFAFVVFWAYIGFSQFMLIWYGNLPEETIWYAHRLEHGWRGVTIALAVGHFVLPFFFLLPRAVKRTRSTLVAASVWLLAMHYLDLYWLVMPAVERHGFHPHLADLVAWLGVGGLFLGTLGLLTARQPLVPVGDPRLAESMAFENT